MNEYIKVVAMYAKIDEDVEIRITRGGKRQVSVKKKHNWSLHTQQDVV